MPSTSIPALGSCFLSSTLDPSRCPHTAPSSPPSTPSPAGENKTNSHRALVKTAASDEAREPPVGRSRTEHHSASDIKLHHPNPLSKPIASPAPGFPPGPLPHLAQTTISAVSPFPPLLFPLFSYSFPGEKHSSQQNKHLKQSSLAFLSGALALPTLSLLPLLPSVIDQGVFPDKESSPCLFSVRDKF